MRSWRGFLAAVLQLIIWLPLWLFVRLYCHGKVSNKLKLNGRGHYLIAANHQSRLDPFVITGSLKFRQLFKLVPLRFITARSYLAFYKYGWLLWPLGGFSNRSGALAEATGLLESGQAVGIFPEGQRSRPGQQSPHRGVAVLANQAGTTLIPVNLNWQRSPRRAKVVVGSSFSGAGFDADQIMERIYRLSQT